MRGESPLFVFGRFRMDLSTAILLIKEGVDDVGSQTWADLGAGKGLFSEALGILVGSGKVVAVDKDAGALRTIRIRNPEIELELLREDLMNVEFPEGSMDGILMANSIHYISEKEGFLRKLVPALKSTGRIIIVEYDMDESNPYVPYPVSFSSLGLLAGRIGLSCEKLAASGSVYQRAGMYSAKLKVL